jgi:protein involved in polysaccharide export with SLBB domain
MARLEARFAAVIWLAVPFILTFLLSAPLSAQVPPSLEGGASAAGIRETYTLGTGDRLRVIVFGEEDLGGEYEIDSGGYVRLPLIGEVLATGLAPSQFEVDVKAKLEDGYLRDARVSVEVINYRPFYIIGEISDPGQYPYVNGMSILNAVALAGGYTYRANESQVYIRRNGEEDEVGFPADQNTKVFPGDFIRISERFF